MTTFCPKCGTTAGPFYQRLCADCFVAGRDFVKTPNTLTVVRCRRCSALQHRRAWLEDSEQNLSQIIIDATKTALHNPQIKTEFRADTAALTVSGSVDEQGAVKVAQQKQVQINYKDVLCEACAKQSSGQYEAEIQLRPAKPHDEERFKKIASAIKKAAHALQQTDERAKAFWWQDSKKGADFFFGYRQTAQQVLADPHLKHAAHSTSRQFLGFTRAGKKKIQTAYCIRV